MATPPPRARNDSGIGEQLFGVETFVAIKTVTTALAAAIMGVTPVVVNLVGSPIASADDAVVHDLGDQANLVNGAVIQGWTLSDLQKSTDQIPYPVQGTLWQATATDEALQGSVVPIVSDLNARAQSGQTYRTLFQVATPQGVNPATLAQGEKTSGKVYFDVTGDLPDSLVYNAGGDDLLVWVRPQAPAPQPQTPSRSTAAPADGHAAPAAASEAGASVAPGNQGAPTSGGWQGTPVAPAAAGSLVSAQPTVPAAPPAGNQGAPTSGGWQGTPAVPAADGSLVSAQSTVPAPPPAGWQGTPLVAAADG
jgi:hypothetical protein